MPAKPVPKRKLAKLKRRFRELVDWAFDSNLTLASRVLEMPFSTVQQYYQKGPRRIDARVVKRIEELFELGLWIIAEEDPQMPDRFAACTGWRLLTIDNTTGPSYWIPEVVMWRVRLSLKAMEDLTGLGKDALIPVLFAPILEGIKVGLLKALPTKNPFPEAPVVLGGELGEDGLQAVYGRHTARKIHKLCEYWEQELEIGPRHRDER